MRIFVDRMILDQAPRQTTDGYLVAVPRIARQGIQEYAAAEVGLSDRAPDARIRVFRPEEEVFHADALHSMAYRPITMDHPPVAVDASNWKEYSVGQTGGEVVRDGEFIRVPMSLMDADAISDVLGGKIELSVGYSADLDWTPGVTPDGQSYDAIQRNIRGNHLAIVDAARGGSQLRVIDTKTTTPKEKPQMRKITLDGISVEVDDTGYEVVQKYLVDAEAKAKTDQEKIKELEDQIAKIKADMKEEHDKAETKDAEIATLKTQIEDAKLTPEKLDQAVADRAGLIDAAAKVIPDLVTDGKSDADIRKEVVTAKLGDTAKDWTDEQIAASFRTLAGTAPASDQVRDWSTKPGELKGRDLYVDRLANPHKYKAQPH